ncbi:MAG: hypothetical protein FJ404_02825 [Verrucomicrobia bacterium]|nr:hypothetical protein [Verrucomicrobiota bacterium]
MPSSFFSPAGDVAGDTSGLTTRFQLFHRPRFIPTLVSKWTIAAILFGAGSTLSRAADTGEDHRTHAGAFHVERPTLHNLGFEWAIRGDANRNATVQVHYRTLGDTAWRSALPLVRVGGENVFRRRENLDYTVPHGFAGSILNLAPETEYECRFEMSDPDGIDGQTSRLARVRTRAEPKAHPGGRILHVYPPDYFGPRQEPSFTGILQAYYGAGLGDWSVVWERRARPGDTLLLHAGLYRPERFNYVDPMMAPFDGSMSLTLKGTADQPITIKAAGDGEVVLDGDGNHRLFDVMASAYHLFEGLTFRNTDVAIFAGQKEVLGAVGLAVKNCRFEQVGFGIWTEYAGSRDFYIADNLFLGREDRFRLVGWGGAAREPGGISWPVPAYGSHRLTSYYAIKVYGPGHVIARNAIAYFHDAIGISTYGTPETDPDRRASSIDIYGNDMHVMNDDFIETDGGVHNIRVYGNRGINAAQGGFSAQPVFGGPAYFYRNVLYHVPSGVAFKFSAKPAGLYVWHNTIISEHRLPDPSANLHFRNNLFLGRDTPDRGILTMSHSTSWNTSDYNGYRPNRGAPEQYRFFQPKPGSNIYEPSPGAWRIFSTLRELQIGTGQEAHSREIDYDIFTRLSRPDPQHRHTLYHAMDLDFSLKSESPVIDAGVRIPTVNEDHSGKGPDLGAWEHGKPLPHYGPAWLTWQPFYR